MLTNEERSLPIYSSDNIPTIAETVNSKTPLKLLNLNWKEQDLRESERTKHVHRLHPYLGKYVPQLVEIFLRKYFKPNQTILDPFCGSGTTLVQANELNINSIGYDISAFNILLSQVKTNEYNIQQLSKEVFDILEKVSNLTKLNDKQLSLFVKEDSFSEVEVNNEYLKSWFAPQSLYELICYRDLIITEGYEYSDLLKIILSRSARSARLTTHFDLDFPKNPQTEPYYCYKHSRICKPVQGAFKFLKRYSIDTVKRIEEFSVKRTRASVDIKHVDNREVDFPLIDGVITSPPYVGLINYHEQHVYAYHLLGLEDLREKEIGPASNGSSKKARAEYQDNIAKVFKRIAKSMKNGGRIIVVAGDKHELYPSIAEQAGLETENVVERHVNRRTGRRASNFFESVFIWRKS